MCKNTTSNKTNAAGEEQTPWGESISLPPPQPKLKLSQFFDTNGTWILVPNGSFRGHFDSVPETFRVGPWNIVCCVYLFVIVSWVVWECVHCYSHPPKVPASDYAFFDVNSWQWWCNAAGFLWTFYIAYSVASSSLGFGVWICYTLQSWTLIMARYGLSMVTPFLPALASWNEHLRFAMVLQTTIVFVLWNFALLPAIYMTMKDGKTKQCFLKFCFSFLLTQLHIGNLPLAVMNGVWGSPARELNNVDFCVALALALQYMVFYLFVLDRIGIHLYFIFSPRSPLALISWTAFVGIHYAGFALWKRYIQDYGIHIS
jgi:hypothetical protein